MATKSKGRSTFGRQKSLTFDKVDRVEHVQLWQRCRRQQIYDRLATNQRQSRKSATLLTFDVVASVYRPKVSMCRLLTLACCCSSCLEQSSSSSAHAFHQSRTIQSWVENPSLQSSLVVVVVVVVVYLYSASRSASNALIVP